MWFRPLATSFAPTRRCENLTARLAITTCVAAVVMCGGETGSQQSAARDSAGIAIVENERPAWRVGGEWSLSEHPMVSLGVANGPDEYQLHRVTGALRLRDGRIVVANSGTAELRFYDTSGAFLGAAGRRGAGPGEFRRVGLLRTLTGDSLLVWDSGNHRVTVMDDRGRYGRSFTASPFVNKPVFVNVLAPLADGTILVGAFGFRSTRAEVAMGLSRDTLVLVRCDREGELIDTVGVYTWEEWFTTPENPREEVPFGRQSFIAGIDDGFYFGDNASYQISRYRSDGSIERIIRKAHAAVPVTARAVAEQKRVWLDAIGDPSTRARVARMLEPVRGPPTMPAYSGLLPDAGGNLWVREFEPTGAETPHWTVFGPEGEMLGEVAMPVQFTPFQVGLDFVLGRWEDETNVEYVQVYRLMKP